MNSVFIIPTGVGADIGGHAGDANPAARLIGSVCDTIILHPNVVNACDINEMPSNALYVDGHGLDEFLAGDIGLESVRSNKVLVAINQSPEPKRHAAVINAISACRVTLGVDAEVAILKEPLILKTSFTAEGLATGTVEGTDAAIAQLAARNFDALALITEIKTSREIATYYINYGGVNPWGVVESLACQPLSKAFRRPVAHAPIDSGHFDNIDVICDPRMSAELVSVAYLFCVVKGLQKAPRWTTDKAKGLWIKDIDLLVSPDMQYGLPHKLCQIHDIPILVVEENKTVLPPANGPCIRVKNYWEAAGWIASQNAGIDPASVRRPLKPTKIQ